MGNPMKKAKGVRPERYGHKDHKFTIRSGIMRQPTILRLADGEKNE